MFHSDIVKGLGDAFEQLIAASMADEMEEIETADAEAEEVARTLGLLIGVTTALVLLATLISGYLLYRSIVRPIRKLSAGAMAIGRGDLAYRVGPLGRDEIGLLAGRFDEMAGQLDEQQRLLLAARVRPRAAGAGAHRRAGGGERCAARPRPLARALPRRYQPRAAHAADGAARRGGGDAARKADARRLPRNAAARSWSRRARWRGWWKT